MAAFFLAEEDGFIVGRLTVLDNRLYNEYNHEKTAFIYQFECEPDLDIAKHLFESGIKWARSRGLNKLLGPKGFTALEGLGLLVKGFELRPPFGLPNNAPFYPEFLESLGFETVNDIISGYLGADIQYPERIHEISARVQERRGLRITRFHNRRELRRAISYRRELYNGALEGTSGGTLVNDEGIKILADHLA